MRNMILALLFSLTGVLAATAQNTIPAIITFTADPAALTVDAAESGTVQVTLAWQVIHMGEGQRLVIYQRGLNTWEQIAPEGDAVLEASGSLTRNATHPLDFGPPTYLLVLLDAEDQPLDERILTMPYEIVPDQRPEITLFTSSTATLSASALVDGSARVNISWIVVNRLPTSNLVFEQVQTDSTAVAVELPRGNLWVQSRGDGVVAPVAPTFGNVLNLRLRVIDVLSGEVYDEAEVEVLVAGDAIAAVPTATSTPEPVDEAEVITEEGGTPGPTPTPRICSISPVDVPLTGAPNDGCDTYIDPRTGATTRVLAFEIDNMNPQPGAPVALTWEVEGAQFALVEVYDPEQLAQGGLPEPALALYDGLPTSGSTTITIPVTLVNGARIVLWAANLSTAARSPSFLYDRLAYRMIDAGAAAALSTNAQITAFIALPQTVEPGGEVTLSWSLTGADAALIELYNRANNALAGTFEDLPTIGSANLIIPEAFTDGVRFVLWAADRADDGTFIRLVSSEVEVPAG
jgi:hypothetical protein